MANLAGVHDRLTCMCHETLSLGKSYTDIKCYGLTGNTQVIWVPQHGLVQRHRDLGFEGPWLGLGPTH